MEDEILEILNENMLKIIHFEVISQKHVETPSKLLWLLKNSAYRYASEFQCPNVIFFPLFYYD